MTMSWAWRSRNGRNPYVPKRLSPWQMVVVVDSRITFMAPGSNVSVSSHMRSYGSSARTSLIAPPSSKAKATSNAMPTSGPSSSRKVRMMWMVLRIAPGEASPGEEPNGLRAAAGAGRSCRGSMLVLTPVKPRSRTSRARRRRSSVVSILGTPRRSARRPMRVVPQCVQQRHRRSRILPPRSCQTGAPRTLPRMSQSAESMPLIAFDANPPV